MADAQTPDEKTVQFINAEVLAPPKQDSISFTKPYIDQSLAMAVEDARSFVQGAEQILLIALAKELEKLVSGGAPAPPNVKLIESAQGSAKPDANTDDAAADTAGTESRTTPKAGLETQQQTNTSPGLKAIESVMVSLSKFHASIADTAQNSKRETIR